jgi:hypothetical protein
MLLFYLFFDYNFISYLNTPNFLNIFDNLLSVILLPINILSYIFLNGNLDFYKFIFLSFSNTFSLLTLISSSILFSYITLILYTFIFFTISNLLYNYKDITNLSAFYKKRFSLFVIADFLPFSNNYNLFFHNSHPEHKSLNVNLSFNLLKSFLFFFKNKLLFNFNNLFSYIINTFFSLYVFFRKPV